MSVSHNLLGSSSIARSLVNSNALTTDRDDFGGNTESGEIGELGWSVTNYTVVAADSDNNHPGITRLRSSATATTICALHREVGAANVRHTVGAVQEFTFNANEWAAGVTDVDHRFGIADTFAANPPTSWIGFEKLAADTTWFLVARTGGNTTRTDTTTAARVTTYYKFEAQKVSATSWRGRINGGTWYTVASNVPIAATFVQPGIQSIPTTNNARDFGVDFFSLIATAPVR